MKTTLLTLTVALLSNFSAFAVDMPPIENGAKLVFKGHAYCGKKKIGKLTKTVTVKNVEADGSYSFKEKDRGITSLISIIHHNYQRKMPAADRVIFEHLNESTNCFNHNGDPVEITYAGGKIPVCRIRYQMNDAHIFWYFTAGHSLPVRSDIFHYPPSNCDDSWSSVIFTPNN